MDKGDVLSILAAVIIVSAVAIAFRLPVADAGQAVPEPVTPGGIPTPAVTATPAPASPVLPALTKISYTTRIWDYPRCHLPANLVSYGGSDPSWQGAHNVIPFAYVEEAKGGITETFHVPYDVWRLNCSVTATVRPEAARFRMALVERESGTIVEGASLQYPGSVIKNVERGGKDFYLIVSVDQVDAYRITLETLPQYLSKSSR
ncbi:hypothetical protein F8E02_11210 [Methanoculleus sp. Wushi-C6]|uniref:Uncharacterized protein n=1 Tax=Methanoculleus caldifontis TaxID=2651577 RepID=A0ABU3X3D5_9EURY|nr:hypothetical protein [Methanoculleus sp. Wushi-C6]MDV2482558.1 hypothetical protein [Methanoculleus sp. Wushi-C6]